jgi:iron complex transport system ATP-binding protein
MRLTDTERFGPRDFRSLSGGERQRVILASALAQQPDALLLDEPTTYLDLQHQVALYRIVRDLCRDGLLAVAVTHDVNLAAAYADRVIVLCDGEVVADGPPVEALDAERLKHVFGVNAEVMRTAAGRPWIRYGD